MIAYSFIIGRNQTLKVIIASYMAVLVADGLGSLFEEFMVPASPLLQGATGEQVQVLLKIFIYVLVILLLTVRGGFRVDILPEKSVIVRILANLVFGFLNAGLLVNTILVYLIGGSFVQSYFNATLQSEIYQESQFVQIMLDHSNIWFALPAIAIVLVSFIEPREA